MEAGVPYSFYIANCEKSNSQFNFGECQFWFWLCFYVVVLAFFCVRLISLVTCIHLFCFFSRNETVIVFCSRSDFRSTFLDAQRHEHLLFSQSLQLSTRR